MKLIIFLVFTTLWLYLLHVLGKGKLYFWKFLAGSVGAFILMIFYARPYLTMPLARCVAAVAGVFGDVTNTFTAYFKFGIIYVHSAYGSITLQIDFECSGIVEIMAFLSLLIFFRVYTLSEKIIVGILGTIGIVLANALRITLICEIIHFFGPEWYSFAHTIVGRMVFYFLSIILYFVVFTKPQIVRMKVGKFSYGTSK